MDDVLLTSFAWDSSEVYTGVLLRGAFLAYAAHCDQFSIKVTGK